jgi:hypothetical protein
MQGDGYSLFTCGTSKRAINPYDPKSPFHVSLFAFAVAVGMFVSVMCSAHTVWCRSLDSVCCRTCLLSVYTGCSFCNHVYRK